MPLLFINCFGQERAKPNILFVIADDASFRHFGAYGSTWVSTPNIDRIAAEGLLFLNAYTPNAKCSPSRASVLTGRKPWQLEEAGNHNAHFPAKYITFPEVLLRNGYHTGYTGKGWAPGNPGTVNGRPRELTGQAYNSLKRTPPVQYISSEDYAENFKAFLKLKKPDQPFCFWVGAREPHRPYSFGAGLANGRNLKDVNDLPAFLPDNDTTRTDLLDYGREIEYVDEHLGSMIKILEDEQQLDNTVIVVTSDNGMPFPRAKGSTYEWSNHMPLVIRWGDGIRNAGRRIDDYVSLIDLAPTFLSIAGIKERKSGMLPIQGRSLSDVFAGDKHEEGSTNRDHVLLGRERHDVGRPMDQGYPTRAIVKGKLLFIVNYEPSRWPHGDPQTGYLDTDGGPTKTWILNIRRKGDDKRFWDLCFGKRPSEELYDLSVDPACVNNLVNVPKYRIIKKSLHKLMVRSLKKQKDPRVRGEGQKFDEYEYADPNVQNFYERWESGEQPKTPWVNESDFESKDVFP